MFYLGAHHPGWLTRAKVPLFVSRNRLIKRRSFPRASARWALDSGAFTQLSIHGRWTVPPAQYAGEVRLLSQEIGSLDFAAPQDWMCEPWIRALQKLRRVERGWRYVAATLVRFGATPPHEGESLSDWTDIWLPPLTRTLRHRGNHKYAWTLAGRSALASLAYPKGIG